MKKQLASRITYALMIVLLALAALPARLVSADVTVTGASGGGSIPADTAADASSPAWTTLVRQSQFKSNLEAVTATFLQEQM